MKYVCKTAIVALLLSGAILVPAAKAGILYDVSTVTIVSHIPYEFSFTEPDFLTTTTTIPEASLTIITSPGGCTLTSATISDPLSATPSISETLTGGCDGSTTNGFTGPFNHDGTYSNGAPLATVLTISGTPTSTVPEPGSLGLLLTAIAAAGLFAKKRPGVLR